MDVLIRFGFTIEEIKNMMDTNDTIEMTPDQEIEKIIDILKKNGCEDKHIKNILLCNPFIITISLNKLTELIKKLKELGLTNLYTLFDSNPYLLNKTKEEIEKLYDKKSYEGLSQEEILDYIQYNIIF